MAATITPVDIQISKLATSFQTAIKATITQESDPLTKLQTKRDSLDVKRSVYADIKTNYDAFQSALQALISSSTSYGLTQTSKSSVTPGTSGTTVLVADTTGTASAATYDISVTQLAKAQTKTSTSSFSPDAAIGKSGTILLGGAGPGTAEMRVKTSSSPDIYTNFIGNTTVSNASLSTVSTGQRELGTGLYTLETRDLDGIRQFRMVNADGNAVSIQSAGTVGSFTSGWQNMSSGNYDTGRGFALNLSSTGTSSSTIIPYTAAGVSLSISNTDSLRSIVTMINSAIQPEGRDLKASIVSNKLVFTGAQTGENHTMLYADNFGLGLGSDIQSAQNAKFTVNGISVSRSSNLSLTDIVDGTTISLASDAEGKTARLSIASSSDKAISLVKTLVDKYNTAINHLKSKLDSIPTTTNGKTTYARGPVSGDTALGSLRYTILGFMNKSYTNSGSIQNFSDLGLNMDKNMNLSMDVAKVSSVMSSKPSDVTAFLDKSLGEIDTVLTSYAGSKGSIFNMLNTIDSQRTSLTSNITKTTASLEVRKQSLYNQYLAYQNQIIDYGYTAQYLGMLYGTSGSTGTNLNTSG